MARSRQISPELFTDSDLAQRSCWARLCFAGLPTLADREGRLKDDPLHIKFKLFPNDPDLDIESVLNELAEPKSYSPSTFINRYEVKGRGYIQIVKFKEYQHPHPKEKESTIPPPPQPTSTHNDTSTKQAVKLHGKSCTSRVIMPLPSYPSYPSVPSLGQAANAARPAWENPDHSLSCSPEFEKQLRRDFPEVDFDGLFRRLSYWHKTAPASKRKKRVDRFLVGRFTEEAHGGRYKKKKTAASAYVDSERQQFDSQRTEDPGEQELADVRERNRKRSEEEKKRKREEREKAEQEQKEKAQRRKAGTETWQEKKSRLQA